MWIHISCLHDMCNIMISLLWLSFTTFAKVVVGHNHQSQCMLEKSNPPKERICWSCSFGLHLHTNMFFRCEWGECKVIIHTCILVTQLLSTPRVLFFNKKHFLLSLGWAFYPKNSIGRKPSNFPKHYQPKYDSSIVS